jgi:DNA repair ATPase RecN
MTIDKQKLREAQEQIERSLQMIASLRSNIEHYIPDLQKDPQSLTNVSNIMAEEIGQLREVFNGLCLTRYHSLLPDSGVEFDKLKEQKANA